MCPSDRDRIEAQHDREQILELCDAGSLEASAYLVDLLRQFHALLAARAGRKPRRGAS